MRCTFTILIKGESPCMFTHEMIASFNELETSLYNYISQNSEKVVYMRIRELANETHVSTASILRFCKK